MDFDTWRDGGNHFEYRGRRVFYQHGGSGHGEALLCIHGFPTASWDWHRLWPALTQRFGVVLAPDLLGFGWSAKPRDHAYSVLDQADLCEALLRQHAITRVHVLAHDLGDSVAQELLARDGERGAPGHIASMVLLNGGLFPETHRPRMIQRLLLTPLGLLLSRLQNRRNFGSRFSAVFGTRTPPTTRELDEFWKLIAHNDGAGIAHHLIRYIPERRQRRARWVGALQRAPIPLRLIAGMDDPVSGAHMVARYRELIAAADVVELPGIGHYPQVEAADAVLRALNDFYAVTASG
jgi:pimeloyl-ACP methyl ester carboxylesterase